MAKTAPLPVLRTFAQARLDRISMNIAQLFHNLRVISNVEIVVPLLPEVLRIASQAPPCFNGSKKGSRFESFREAWWLLDPVLREISTEEPPRRET